MHLARCGGHGAPHATRKLAPTTWLAPTAPVSIRTSVAAAGWTLSAAASTFPYLTPAPPNPNPKPATPVVPKSLAPSAVPPTNSECVGAAAAIVVVVR